jgi:hypothetical protein
MRVFITYYLKNKMRLYIKTPLYNESKMVPHLVEHCL